MRDFNKIIVIGQNKTGTNSLCRALVMLGLDGIHDEPKYNKNEYAEGMREGKSLEDMGIPNVDFYSDWPFLTVDSARYFYTNYSNLLFINLERNFEDCIKSVYNHIKLLRKLGNDGAWGDYKTADDWLDNKEKIIEMWKDRRKKFHEFLNDIPKDISLTMNICDNNDGWNELCNFLEVEVLDGPFPKLNTSESNQSEKWFHE
tara:strand:+ start:51 stop:656 length:606 start_codon:yes stop_codon:yes gene_type:complete